MFYQLQYYCTIDNCRRLNKHIYISLNKAKQKSLDRLIAAQNSNKS